MENHNLLETLDAGFGQIASVNNAYGEPITAQGGDTKQKMPLNAAWHKAHKMPKNPTTEDRIAWHKEHSKVCGCRPMPASLIQIIEKESQDKTG